jgi:N-methylhydantoinase A
LVAPGRVDRVATVGFRLDDHDPAELECVFTDLERDAQGVIAATGLDPASTQFNRLADGRFVGQGFDLVVNLPGGPYTDDRASVRQSLVDAFIAGYHEKFGRTPPNVPIEFMNVRLSATAPVPGGEVLLSGNKGDGGATPTGTRPAYFPETGYVDTAVYDRPSLHVGDEFPGPAIIEDSGSTLIVGPSAKVRVADTGNVIVTLPEGDSV